MKIVTSRIPEASPSPADQPSAPRPAPPSGTPIPQTGAAAPVADILLGSAPRESATDWVVRSELHEIRSELHEIRRELRSIDGRLDRLDDRVRELEVRFTEEIAAVWRARQRWYLAVLLGLSLLLAYSMFR